MNPATLADIVVISHILYVGFVVLAVPLIIVGAVLRWGWVHNIGFRCIHLLMIGIVVAESLLGIPCPLTVWERALRANTGPRLYEDQDFIAGWLDKLLFYQFPHWVFTTAYVSFGALVAGLIFIVPIRRKAQA